MITGLSPVMVQAHIEVIMQKDTQYFDGIKYIGDIPRECIALPTDEELAAEFARLNHTPVVRQSQINPTATTTNN
ncbi:uncharacterized protein PGTG_21128 [Puccinia graminis f. sp. tritici CRL 75-36-700-3]|uniref:Uncharacterized protein n=1 Tax=Puccinia graminis f. sp. tritici (strain CRL 75-36-700-3 / race SCCL) TaxID=418459 RepID=H6QQH1_PUCGT|nr:uncharacterized protein PGTG_21128 [Puccinia graminis f. sp. tritici CRL 75-36-700-3]EHS62582.1 hypothetical protein PGTG_21128 [Puccinia graminis f. sp. tritici CRL 75-36-700-3]